VSIEQDLLLLPLLAGGKAREGGVLARRFEREPGPRRRTGVPAVEETMRLERPPL